eukprot:1160908-Pelagomonas_calceolata.AAC.15
MARSRCHARVWAAGGMEVVVQQTNPNFQEGRQFVDLQASCECLSGQMDGESKEEQVGTLVVRKGAPEGGFWGGVVGLGCPAQNLCASQKKFLPPDAATKKHTMHQGWVVLGFQSCST